MKKSRFLLFIIIGVALFSRLFHLQDFPIGAANDELEFAISAKYLFHTGSDITGTWKPWELTSLPNSVSAIPVYLISPFVGLLGLNLFSIRLPSVIFMTANVYLLYLLALHLTKKYQPSLLVAFVFALNPWSLHFSRNTYEPPFVIFFFLLAIYLLLTKKKWRAFISLPFFFLAFHSYVGTKLIFLPIVIFTSFFAFKFQKTITKSILIKISLIALAFFSFWLIGFKESSISKKQTQFVFSQVDLIALIRERNYLWTIKTPLRPLLNHPILISTKTIVNNYLRHFSPEYLFVGGDPQPGYSFWIHGYFYFLAAPLIILGLIYLHKYHFQAFLYLIGLIILAPIPGSLLAGDAYAVRSSLIFPLLSILSGLGLYYAFKSIKFKIINLGIIGLYMLLIGNFFHLYYFSYPLYAAEGSMFYRRLLSQYLNHVQQNEPTRKVYVYPPDLINNAFQEYYFYSAQNYSLAEVRDKKLNLSSNNFTFGQITFTKDFGEILDPEAIYIIDNLHSHELLDQVFGHPTLAITSLSDLSVKYFIYNDTETCLRRSIIARIKPEKITDLYLNELTFDDFCRRWITGR